MFFYSRVWICGTEAGKAGQHVIALVGMASDPIFTVGGETLLLVVFSGSLFQESP